MIILKGTPIKPCRLWKLHVTISNSQWISAEGMRRRELAVAPSTWMMAKKDTGGSSSRPQAFLVHSENERRERTSTLGSFALQTYLIQSNNHSNELLKNKSSPQEDSSSLICACHQLLRTLAEVLYLFPKDHWLRPNHLESYQLLLWESDFEFMILAITTKRNSERQVVWEIISSHCQGTIFIPATGKNRREVKRPRQFNFKQGFCFLQCLLDSWSQLESDLDGRNGVLHSRDFSWALQVFKWSWCIHSWMTIMQLIRFVKLPRKTDPQDDMVSHFWSSLEGINETAVCPVERAKSTKILSCCWWEGHNYKCMGNQYCIKTSGTRTQRAWAVGCCKRSTAHCTALDLNITPVESEKKYQHHP